MINVSILTRAELQRMVAIRPSETKIGELLHVFDSEWNTCRYVILGIAEDLGPQANLGLEGARHAFESFVSRFVNIQSNRFLQGETIGILGMISVTEVPDELSEKRKLVSELDDVVYQTLVNYVPEGATPIVIGGGHNNALPLIRWAHKHRGLQRVINIDPHADFRPLEGRHSGNAFSTAVAEGSLEKYAVIGLHENYNSESMLQRLEQHDAWFSTLEDYLDHPEQWQIDFQQLVQSKHVTGLDIDLDAIAFSPSSAFTPSGFTVEQIRTMLRQLVGAIPMVYLHLPEAAPISLRDEQVSGKILTYLVSDFIKKHTEHA